MWTSQWKSYWNEIESRKLSSHSVIGNLVWISSFRSAVMCFWCVGARMQSSNWSRPTSEIVANGTQVSIEGAMLAFDFIHYYWHFDKRKKRCEADSSHHKSSAIEQWRKKRQYSLETLSKSNYILVFILSSCLCARIFVSALLQRSMVCWKKMISWMCCNRCVILPVRRAAAPRKAYGVRV